MCYRRATAIVTPQSVNAHALSLVHGVLAYGGSENEMCKIPDESW
jgi:hypothetical protein